MDDLLGLQNSTEPCFWAGADDRIALPLLRQGRRYTEPRNGVQSFIAFVQKQNAVFRLADSRGILQHGIENRRQLARRPADDPQDLGGRRLLLQRLA